MYDSLFSVGMALLDFSLPERVESTLAYMLQSNKEINKKIFNKYMDLVKLARTDVLPTLHPTQIRIPLFVIYITLK